MAGFLAPIVTSILEEILWKAGKWMTETARAIRSRNVGIKSSAKIKKITRKSQGNFRVIRLDKMAD
jgi:hypothetical protein